ncbi:helix-turn-helix domain-containing protein [uncultured Sphingomonas sp.]|uniref:helix-turn-helix domain-containing protein n=1 Tax=uncultured Sphingomonas sp. TaxID=158754 RepID=UPI0025DFF582|nr:helix-turn-helix domain-containing protein [uncultured Sphingomonas sp.]
MPDSPQQLSYTIDQAASTIGIGRTTLYRLISEGRLPTVKLGRRTLIRHVDLVRLIAPDGQKAA